jgi:hypothetical protein
MAEFKNTYAAKKKEHEGNLHLSHKNIEIKVNTPSTQDERTTFAAIHKNICSIETRLGE